MDERDYLAHHGILGQKWGHQNGPPYPLRDGARSALEKANAIGKKAHDSYKSYRVKKKRNQALEKARKTKAENKRIAEEGQAKAEKKAKKEEQFNKFVEKGKDAKKLAEELIKREILI